MHQYFKVLLDENKANKITNEVIYSIGQTKNGFKIRPPEKNNSTFH